MTKEPVSTERMDYLLQLRYTDPLSGNQNGVANVHKDKVHPSGSGECINGQAK
jgi:hypothetical protein